jgi:hypothetical protein
MTGEISFTVMRTDQWYISGTFYSIFSLRLEPARKVFVTTKDIKDVEENQELLMYVPDVMITSIATALQCMTLA